MKNIDRDTSGATVHKRSNNTQQHTTTQQQHTPSTAATATTETTATTATTATTTETTTTHNSTQQQQHEVQTHSFSLCEVRCRCCSLRFWYLHVVASSWRTRQYSSKAAGATTQTVASARTSERRHGPGREYPPSSPKGTEEGQEERAEPHGHDPGDPPFPAGALRAVVRRRARRGAA